MKLVKKSIVKLKIPIPVYDIQSESESHNFCLSNGVVVHNSKDISDAVSGAVFDLYDNIDLAGQLSVKYKVHKYSEQFKQRAIRPDDDFQQMINEYYG